MPTGSYFVHTLLRARDWQHRPEFDQVCDWWHGGGRGVCALVGMGGAGKTAIAERFLCAALDGNTEPDPHSVFVYSFYDDDKPENLFRRLQIWLEGSPKLKRELSVSQIMFLVQQHQGLIILDGLEMVQESGARGGFGRLASPSLRDLLNHIASGSARELSVLVTSRFPLTDLRDSQPRYFHTIDIDEIEVEAGIALLRSRGVSGTDVQLAPIVEHCGRHALTVDLAGGYIKAYGHGDPTTPLNLGTTEELQAEAEQEPDDNKRAVLKQGIRFARIAQRYREAMLNSDEAAIALLERICLFRLGVGCEALAAIFTGPAAEKVSGKALSSLDAKQLQRKLDWLVRMGVVEVNEFQSAGASTRRFTIHPAVRDGFLHGFGRDAAMESHEAIRVGIERAIEDRDAGFWLLEDGGYVPTEDGDRIRLENKPGEQTPTDHGTLDLFEEIIHHALQTRNATLAWDVYHKRMGGCRNLIAGLNDYGRAARITAHILKASAADDKLPDSVITILQSDHGYCCLELGKLVEAKQSLLRGRDACQKTKNENLKTLSRNLACALTELGYLERAQHTLRSSLPYLRDPDVVLKTLIHIAQIGTLRGNVQITIADSDITEHTPKPLPRTLCASLPLTIRHDSLDLHRRLDEFKRQVETMRGQFEAGHSALTEARLDLCARLLWHGDVVGASNQVSMSHEWAVAHDARRFVCHCGLARAKIALSVMYGQLSALQEHRTDDLAVAETAIIQGLKIARDSGFSLYHIDLLLERARLHLLRGDPRAALGDIELALDIGIPADEHTGQPELLAANDEECGYAWGIVEGLHLRGEALLLRAAHTIGSESFEPAERDQLPTDVCELIVRAESCLNDAMSRWQDLRDPERTEDNNYVHPTTGVEYNYRAAETYRVLKDLVGGILTKYPLTCLVVPDGELVYLRGESSVEGLLKITGCEDPDRVGDVVFVHGLDGDAKTTWHPKGKPDDFWPAWLGGDLPNVGVWSLGYEVSSSAWKGGTMPLSDRATHTLALLETQGFGRRPIVFICHSLGGLLVKQLLRHSNDFGSDEWKAIIAQTRGIVFLSTPHSGADMADWIKYIGSLLRTTVTVDELKAHDPRLRELNNWYRNYVGGLGIKTQAYCEKKKVAGILVVNETSADPGIAGVVPIPMDDDHISICKPCSKDSLVYLRVKQFVETLFANP